MDHTIASPEPLETAATPDPAEQIAEGFDPIVQQMLAALHGAPRAVIDLTLVTQPFGTRSLLRGMALIAGGVGDEEASPPTVTPLGLAVIDACARRHEHLDRDVDAAVGRLRKRLYHPEQARRLKLDRS